MRTIPATGCGNFQVGGTPDERQGIIYYKPGSTEYPFTGRGNFNITCSDEPYSKLQPVRSWTIPPPPGLSEPQPQPYSGMTD